MLLNILDMQDSPQQIMILPKMSTVLSNCQNWPSNVSRPTVLLSYIINFTWCGRWLAKVAPILQPPRPAHCNMTVHLLLWRRGVYIPSPRVGTCFG